MVSPVSSLTKCGESMSLNKYGFPTAKGGCQLRVIADAPHLLSFVDSNIVDRIILAFSTQSVSAPAPPPLINRAEIRRSSLAVFATASTNPLDLPASSTKRASTGFAHKVPSFSNLHWAKGAKV